MHKVKTWKSDLPQGLKSEKIHNINLMEEFEFLTQIFFKKTKKNQNWTLQQNLNLDFANLSFNLKHLKIHSMILKMKKCLKLIKFGNLRMSLIRKKRKFWKNMQRKNTWKLQKLKLNTCLRWKELRILSL